MSSAKFRFLPVVLLVAAAVVAGGLWARARYSLPRTPNVILISIDTCRADYLSCYGHPRQTTPNIDTVAAEAIVFSQVITSVPTTLPAHCSMLTGTIPPYHGVHANIAYRLRESNVTLAEHLRDHGYRTAGVVGAFVLHSQFGIAQGFDTYDDEIRMKTAVVSSENERKAGEVTRLATAWLQKHAEETGPFFLFVHYFDPHFPYEPPVPFASTFADERYAGEVAYADHGIGKLLQTLKDLKLYDPALLIITGDHGEGLGDHGEPTHGYFIYHSTTRVPLIVKPPKKRRFARVDKTVSLIDVVPTVLQATGIPIPSAVQGRDLSPYWTGESRNEDVRFVYSESLTATQYGCTSLLGLQTDQWKYIQASKPELYDLPKDPDETTNVIDKYPQHSRMLRERLRALLETRTRVFDSAAVDVMDEETRARLEALGYIGGRLREDFEFETDREDPKDFFEFFNKTANANRMFRAGLLREAKTACLEILSQRPDIAMAHEVLGKVSIKLGDVHAAGVEFEEVLKLDPYSSTAYYELGRVRLQQGRTDEAIELFEKAARVAAGVIDEDSKVDRVLEHFGEVDPMQFQARLNLANTLFDLGRFEEAVVQYRETLRLDLLPTNRARYQSIRARTHYALGLALQQLGKTDQAIEAFRESLKLDPDFKDARTALDGAITPP